jgi:hypothetical protein
MGLPPIDPDPSAGGGDWTAPIALASLFAAAIAAWIVRQLHVVSKSSSPAMAADAPEAAPATAQLEEIGARSGGAG